MIAVWVWGLAMPLQARPNPHIGGGTLPCWCAWVAAAFDGLLCSYGAVMCSPWLGPAVMLA